MFSSFGGLASHVVISFSLLASFFEPCIQTRLSFHVPCLGHILWVWQCLIYLSCTLLGYTLIGNVQFISQLCVLALCMIYIYIYICLLMGGHALCIMDSHGQESNPLVIMGALDLVVWVCAQDNCRRCILCYIVCIIIAV